MTDDILAPKKIREKCKKKYKKLLVPGKITSHVGCTKFLKGFTINDYFINKFNKHYKKFLYRSSNIPNLYSRKKDKKPKTKKKIKNIKYQKYTIKYSKKKEKKNTIKSSKK